MPKIALWMIAAGRKREAKVKKPVRKISKRQSKRLREYAAIRRKYLDHPDNILCRVCVKDGHGRLATEIHHRRGKVGSLLFDVRWFLPVCAKHHRFLHDNVAWAYKEGWMVSRA